MNHPRRPARTQLWILAGAAAIGLTLYLTIPGSLTYVLIGLFVLLHFVMHAGHDHGAHGHNQHDHNQHDHNQHDHAATDAPSSHGAQTHGAQTHGAPTSERTGAAPLATVPITTPAHERTAAAQTVHDRHDWRGP